MNREEYEEQLMRKNPPALSVLLSKERTLLSRERTATALAQLALGIAAFGFLAIRFFADGEYEWFLQVGLIFVLVSGWLFYHAFRQYRHFQKKLANLHNKRGHLDTVYGTELDF
jgi:uncharacterized membrane protein YidH (DUF202 family)